MIPAINAYGRFTVLAPYELQDTNYKCGFIQSIWGLLNQGIDVYTLYYLSKGVTVDIYNADKLANISIITLSNDNNDIVYIPSTYIVTSPSDIIVPYEHKVISVDLGVLPEQLMLDNSVSDIISSIHGRLGIMPVVATHILPIKRLYTFEEYTTLEVIRLQEVATFTSSAKAILELNSTIDALRTRISLLEAEVIKLQ